MTALALALAVGLSAPAAQTPEEQCLAPVADGEGEWSEAALADLRAFDSWNEPGKTVLDPMGRRWKVVRHEYTRRRGIPPRGRSAEIEWIVILGVRR